MRWLEDLKQNRITVKGVTHYGASGMLSNRIITAFPLLMVNIVAFSGQLSWAHDNLKSWHTIGQFAFALSLESVAIFLAYNAYLCEKRNDSAFRLKIASYIFALVVAGINYSHFAKPWDKPNAVAVVVGIMSAASPWLWGIYSRSVSRSILFSRNLIEEHGLRLGATRWVWHPIRSAKVMYMATWIGGDMNRPGKAIHAWEESEQEKAAEKAEKALQMTYVDQSSNGHSSHPIDIETAN